MCNPETKQSYVVLRSIAEAQEIESISELEGVVSNFLKKQGCGNVNLNHLGPLDIKEIASDFVIGDIIKKNSNNNWLLTELGQLLMRIQRKSVLEVDPRLAL